MASQNNWAARGKTDPRYNSKQWKATRLIKLAESTTCALCGHGSPPANTVDHIESVETHPELFFTLANLQPMHGTKSKCTVCAEASNGAIKGDCQSIKSSLPMDQAQDRLYRRTGLRYGQLPGQPAPELPEPSPARAEAYETLNHALEDLANPDGTFAPGDLAEIYRLADVLPCKHGPADGSGFCGCLSYREKVADS